MSENDEQDGVWQITPKGWLMQEMGNEAGERLWAKLQAFALKKKLAGMPGTPAAIIDDGGGQFAGLERGQDDDDDAPFSPPPQRIGEASDDWKCILEFDDQSESFALGFQAGRVWEQMSTGKEFTALVSGGNLELVQRMPTRRGYTFHIAEAGDGWYRVVAVPPSKT